MTPQQVMSIYPLYNPPMVACLNNLIYQFQIPHHHFLSLPLFTIPLSSCLDTLKNSFQASTLKTFNIISTSKLSVKFTFETCKDFNLNFRWFNFGREKSLFVFNFDDDEEPELNVGQTSFISSCISTLYPYEPCHVVLYNVVTQQH